MSFTTINTLFELLFLPRQVLDQNSYSYRVLGRSVSTMGQFYESQSVFVCVRLKLF